MELLLQPGKLTLADLRQAYHQPIKVKLDESASAAINASVACVEKIVNEGRTAMALIQVLAYSHRPKLHLKI